MDRDTVPPAAENRDNDIEVVLGREQALQPALLEIPSRMTLGESTSPKIHCGTLHLRTSRPVARNLQTLYRRDGRPIPDEYEIFWDHELWLLSHSVTVIRGGDDAEIDNLCYEIRFPEDATVLEALPQAPYVSNGQDVWKCEADLGLNGTASSPAGNVSVSIGSENFSFQGTLSFTNRQESVARITFDAITPLIQVTGVGGNIIQFVFSRLEKPLAGVQSVVELVMVDKFAEILPCAVRLQGTISGLNGARTRLRSKWIPFTVRLAGDESS